MSCQPHFSEPDWNIYAVTIWDITKIITGEAFELVLRVLKLLVPDAESRKTIILKNFKNVYEIASLNQHLVAEILGLCA